MTVIFSSVLISILINFYSLYFHITFSNVGYVTFLDSMLMLLLSFLAVLYSVIRCWSLAPPYAHLVTDLLVVHRQGHAFFLAALRFGMV